jgi:hypothetical protein
MKVPSRQDLARVAGAAVHVVTSAALVRYAGYPGTEASFAPKQAADAARYAALRVRTGSTVE